MMFKLPSDSKDLMIRLQLIKSDKIYSIQVLTSLLEKAKTDSLSKEETKKIIDDFKSDEYGFDDIYKIKLAVCDWLLNIERKSDEFILMIDPESRQWQKMANIGGLPEDYGTKEYIIRRKESLKSLGEKMIVHVRKEVRVRLSLLEIFTRILPDDLIPKLIEVCPKYLECSLVQKWIMKNQFFSIHGEGEQRDEATAKLKRLNRALLPDKRKRKRQSLEYWQLDRYFNKLTSYIVGSRIAKIEKRLDRGFMNTFYDIWEIPEEYQGHFESDEIGPKELALSIMVSKGAIKSESSFREFQPKVNKLKEKHMGIELSLILEDVLDLPIHRPQMIANPKLWDLLT